MCAYSDHASVSYTSLLWNGECRSSFGIPYSSIRDHVRFDDSSNSIHAIHIVLVHLCTTYVYYKSDSYAQSF